MNYDTKKHKPMLITTDVKDELDEVKKMLIIQNLEDGGTGRISYGDTISFLIKIHKSFRNIL
jgi:hypothetical protein